MKIVACGDGAAIEWDYLEVTGDSLEDFIDLDKANELIKQLQEIFPELKKREAKAFLRGKAAVQFPLCACQFDDDEETILSPCLAHAEWKRN